MEAGGDVDEGVGRGAWLGELARRGVWGFGRA
jgi:hypothetical protein